MLGDKRLCQRHWLVCKYFLNPASEQFNMLLLPVEICIARHAFPFYFRPDWFACVFCWPRNVMFGRSYSDKVTPEWRVTFVHRQELQRCQTNWAAPVKIEQRIESGNHLATSFPFTITKSCNSKLLRCSVWGVSISIQSLSKVRRRFQVVWAASCSCRLKSTQLSENAYFPCVAIIERSQARLCLCLPVHSPFSLDRSVQNIKRETTAFVSPRNPSFSSRERKQSSPQPDKRAESMMQVDCYRTLHAIPPTNCTSR